MDKLKSRRTTTLILHIAGVFQVVLFVLAVLLTKDSPVFRVGDCSFRELVGLYCFGCGGTRSVMALLRGDLISSFIYYPTLPITLVMILYWDVVLLLAHIKKKTSLLRLAPWQMWLAVPILILVQWILRNLLALYAGYDPLGNLTSCINLFLT